MGDVVVGDLVGSARSPVATLVRGEHMEPGVGEGGQLMSPGVAQLGEAVGEHDEGTVGWPCLVHVQLDAVDRHGAGGHLRHDARSSAGASSASSSSRDGPVRSGRWNSIRPSHHVERRGAELRFGEQVGRRDEQVEQAGEAASEDRFALGGEEQRLHGIGRPVTWLARRLIGAGSVIPLHRHVEPRLDVAPRIRARTAAHARPRLQDGRGRRRRGASIGRARGSSRDRRSGWCTCARRRRRGARARGAVRHRR